MSRGHVSAKWLVVVVVGEVLAVVAVLLPARDEQGAPQRPAPREVATAPQKPRATSTRAPAAPVPKERVPAAKAPEAETETRLEAARRASNEHAAIAMLCNVAVAQTQFQASAKADEDGDGVGQFGSFGELSGRKTARDNGYMLKPLLPTEFGDVTHGCVTRSGYRFRMFLPQADGQPVPERDGGGFGRGETDPDLSEAYWCAYAWPAEGRGRAFFVNQEDVLLEAPAGKYVGDQGPDEYSAFARAHGGLTAPLATSRADSRGTDHNDWKPVK